VLGFGNEKLLDAPEVRVVRTGRTQSRVEIEAADEPYWLVLGQTQNRGWNADVRGGPDLGGSQLVDGFANGWLVDPADLDGAQTDDGTVAVDLEWTPQRRVWIALALSIVGALLCLGLIVWSALRRRASPAAFEPTEEPARWFEWKGDAVRSPVRLVVAVVVAAIVGGVFVAPWVGALAAVVALLAARLPRTRVLVRAYPALAMFGAGVFIAAKQVRQELPPVFEWPTFFGRVRTPAWIAVVLLVVTVVVERLAGRRAGGAEGATDE
jgi:hypothetical protein